jgi:hypothetical protein
MPCGEPSKSRISLPPFLSLLVPFSLSGFVLDFYFDIASAATGRRRTHQPKAAAVKNISSP